MYCCCCYSRKLLFMFLRRTHCINNTTLLIIFYKQPEEDANINSQFVGEWPVVSPSTSMQLTLGRRVISMHSNHEYMCSPTPRVSCDRSPYYNEQNTNNIFYTRASSSLSSSRYYYNDQVSPTYQRKQQSRDHNFEAAATFCFYSQPRVSNTGLLSSSS